MSTTNFVLAGVGGQGTILASDVVAQTGLHIGLDAKKSEVHGMAQRGGDVTTHFRFGKKVYSPLIKQGDVDYLVSFELLEALRYINWLKPDGKIILNNYSIFPPTVRLGKLKYPKDVDQTFRKYFKENVFLINGSDIAKKLGNKVTICRKSYIDPKEQVLFFKRWGYRPPESVIRDVFLDEEDHN